MGDYLPRFIPGQAFTRNAAGVITGGSLVSVDSTGGVVLAAADSASVIGVAGFDAVAGEPVTVFREGVQRLRAAGAVAAGARVAAAAGGAVAATGTNFVGIALQAATKAGDVIDVVWMN